MILSQSQPLFVLDGLFANEVADHLKIKHDFRVSQTAFNELKIISTNTVVSISEETSPNFRDNLDKMCAQWRVPSVGMHLTPTTIECGPAVIPGKTACFACYRARISQHSAGVEGYDPEDSVQGLEPGFGNHHVALASGLLLLALHEMCNGPIGLGATVRTANLVSGSLSQASVIAVNHCDRCGSRFRNNQAYETVPNFNKIKVM